jgi:MFS family permease
MARERRRGCEILTKARLAVPSIDKAGASGLDRAMVASTIQASSPADSRGRWAVSAMFLVNGFLMGSWAPQIPFMLPRHGIGEFELGLLILTFGAGAVGAMVFAGALIHALGSRKVVMIMATIACLSLSLVVFAPSVMLVAVALVVFGATGGTMDVAMNANSVEVERRLNRAIMSASHGFWSLGGFIGGSIGGVLIANFGVHAHAALISALSLAITWAFAPMLVTEAHHEEGGAAKPKFAWPKGTAIFILGFMALFCMIPEGGVLDWSALYLSKELNADVATSGLPFGLFSAAMALMRFLGDGVRNRFGAVATMRISGAVAALGMLAAALAPDSWFAIAAFALAGAGIANMVPIAFSAAGAQPGLSPGVGISIVTMTGYSGILVAPSAIGFVAQHVGFRVTFVAIAALLLVVALLARRVGAADRGATADVADLPV